jgi:hypothetical protein
MDFTDRGKNLDEARRHLESAYRELELAERRLQVRVSPDGRSEALLRSLGRIELAKRPVWDALEAVNLEIESL